MDSLFEVHKLNEVGLEKARKIAVEFDGLLAEIQPLCVPEGQNGSREFSLVRTKLEEAAFFAKKCMAMQTQNQE